MKLKKRWIKNFYKYFKWTYVYYNLKAIESYRFVKNLNKLSEELLDIKGKVFVYLVKSYKLENNQQALEILKWYFDRLFSTPEYINLSNRENLINNIFLKLSDFNFFYGIEEFKNYIDNFIFDIDSIKEVEIEYATQKTIDTEIAKEKKIKQVLEDKVEDIIKYNRLNYNIWLVFWDKKSYKSFKRFIELNKEVFKDLWFSRNYDEQFEIIETEFKKQNKIDTSNLKNRMLWLWRELNFILVFEMDHETKLIKLLNDEEFNYRLTVNDKHKQHFSNKSFKNMLLEWLEKYERNVIID